MSFSVHFLLLHLGKVLGISGFFHTIIVSFLISKYLILGLSVGGILLSIQTDEWWQNDLGIRLFDDVTTLFPFSNDIKYPWLCCAFFGLLVGVGTKLGSGCTSGHFLCGLSRLSPRSIVATLVFFSIAVLTHCYNNNLLPRSQVVQENVPTLPNLLPILLLQIPALVYVLVPWLGSQEKSRHQIISAKIVSFAIGLHFAFGLALSGMLRPSKVLGFLSLSPFLLKKGIWDPSLALVAIGGIVPASFGYFFQIKPYLNQKSLPTLYLVTPEYRIPLGFNIDKSLILGATLFGIGWGSTGLCPGPVIVSLSFHLSKAIFQPQGQGLILGQLSLFVVAMALGGILV